jgi:hypothetical protein
MECSQILGIYVNHSLCLLSCLCLHPKGQTYVSYITSFKIYNIIGINYRKELLNDIYADLA